MGREAAGQVRFGGQSGTARLLLEPQEIILRGAVRGRIMREAITDVRVEAGVLCLQTPDGPLRAYLGTGAEGFARALAKPAPSLAEKLGLGDTRRVLVLTPLTDAGLMAAVAPWHSPLDGAALTLAELTDPAVFAALLPQLPPLPFWGITVKGKTAAFCDADLRTGLRAAGWIDSKSCAVSDRMTATRYGLRKTL